MSAATCLFLGLPLLLSLAARGVMPKALCLVCSGFAILVCNTPHDALLPWLTGMAIATVALYERLRRNSRLNALVTGGPFDNFRK